MKDSEFIKTLYEKRKIEPIEPSENITKAYMRKSESYLSPAKILYEKGHLEESVTMAYYSMYYLALAAFHRAGIKSETHAGTIAILRECFQFDTKELIKAKKERIDKQYYVDFNISGDETLKTIKTAEEFNARLLHKISQLNSEETKKITEKLQKIIADKKIKK